jgi:hypothetical protein
MNLFWAGLIVGSVFGIALSIILTRVAGSVRWVTGLFGFSDETKKIKDLERRVAEKDRYIKKAIEAFTEEGGEQALPPEPEE